MPGPAQRSGRRRGDPLTTRTEPVRLLLRPGERADLETIAAGWDVPLATATWALVATELARLRREAVDLGELGLVIAATRRALEHAVGASDHESPVSDRLGAA